MNAWLRRRVGKLRHFRFGYTDAGAAFGEECSFYYDYRPGHNPAHPEPPIGDGWARPR